MCKSVGIDFEKLKQKDKRTKRSVSIEQMLLFEKIQKHLYTQIDNQLKGKIHLKTLAYINAKFLSKPELQDWVKPVVYNEHRKDLEWLKEEYGIDFLQNYPPREVLSDLPIFEDGKAVVRDIYKVPNEELVEKYEALVVDALLKKLVEIN